MIIDYNSKYNEAVKDLLYELHEYIMSIDKEGYNVISEEFKDDFYEKVMKGIKEYKGKIMLYKQGEKIVGLIVGSVNNEKVDDYDFKAPKRGRINELIVNKEYRGKGIGQKLFDAMEKYLRDLGCQAILIEVFGYNDSARKFYEKNGYHLRMTEMIKVDD